MARSRHDRGNHAAEDAFRAFAVTIAPTLAGYFRRRLYPLSAADVDELVNDTLLVIWRRWSDVPAGAEVPWSLGVARHILGNARRGNRRRVAMESRLAPDPHGLAAEDIVVADVALSEALVAVSEGDREIIVLSAWDGLSIAELAVHFDISENAATVRLSRAHSRLQEILESAERSGDKRTGEQ